MKLIVGLGNPGRKYTETRHNVGFRVAAELAARYAVAKPRAKFRGETVEALAGNVRILLLCPHTYMNLSGASVVAARDFYKVENSELLVVCDDFNLPLARLRIRSKGSSGGQKGLEDIIRRLGTEEFPRLRIGIGPVRDGWDVMDFVLSKFDKEEAVVVSEAVQRAADAAAMWATEGIQPCMNRYNAG